LTNRPLGIGENGASDDDAELRCRMLCAASHVTEDVLHEHEEVSDRAMMRALPEEERIKIQQQVQMFRIEKAKLDREVAKWDESGNDIIIIAKQMCMIMMEMTDFTRYRCTLLLLQVNDYFSR